MVQVKLQSDMEVLSKADQRQCMINLKPEPTTELIPLELLTHTATLSETNQNLVNCTPIDPHYSTSPAVPSYKNQSLTDDLTVHSRSTFTNAPISTTATEPSTGANEIEVTPSPAFFGGSFENSFEPGNSLYQPHCLISPGYQTTYPNGSYESREVDADRLSAFRTSQDFPYVPSLNDCPSSYSSTAESVHTASGCEDRNMKVKKPNAVNESTQKPTSQRVHMRPQFNAVRSAMRKQSSTFGGLARSALSASLCSRASYMCRKCKTHGLNIPVKRHKRACPYMHCTCLKCQLVDQGRKVVARQIALYRDQKGGCSRDNAERSSSTRGRWNQIGRPDQMQSRRSTLSESARVARCRPMSRADSLETVQPQVLSNENTGGAGLQGKQSKQSGIAGPHCRRCRNHSLAVTWKGHKKVCPFRNCPCDPCRLINVRKDTEKTLREMVGHSADKVLGTTRDGVTPDVSTELFETYTSTLKPNPMATSLTQLIRAGQSLGNGESSLDQGLGCPKPTCTDGFRYKHCGDQNGLSGNRSDSGEQGRDDEGASAEISKNRTQQQSIRHGIKHDSLPFHNDNNSPCAVHHSPTWPNYGLDRFSLANSNWNVRPNAVGFPTEELRNLTFPTVENPVDWLFNPLAVTCSFESSNLHYNHLQHQLHEGQSQDLSMHTRVMPASLDSSENSEQPMNTKVEETEGFGASKYVPTGFSDYPLMNGMGSLGERPNCSTASSGADTNSSLLGFEPWFLGRSRTEKMDAPTWSMDGDVNTSGSGTNFEQSDSELNKNQRFYSPERVSAVAAAAAAAAAMVAMTPSIGGSPKRRSQRGCSQNRYANPFFNSNEHQHQLESWCRWPSFSRPEQTDYGSHPLGHFHETKPGAYTSEAEYNLFPLGREENCIKNAPNELVPPVRGQPVSSGLHSPWDTYQDQRVSIQSSSDLMSFPYTQSNHGIDDSTNRAASDLIGSGFLLPGADYKATLDPVSRADPFQVLPREFYGSSGQAHSDSVLASSLKQVLERAASYTSIYHPSHFLSVDPVKQTELTAEENSVSSSPIPQPLRPSNALFANPTSQHITLGYVPPPVTPSSHSTVTEMWNNGRFWSCDQHRVGGSSQDTGGLSCKQTSGQTGPLETQAEVSQTTALPQITEVSDSGESHPASKYANGYDRLLPVI